MHHTVIRRRRGFAGLQLAEVWNARELVAFLAWRDILVRYKQTMIGVAWALIRPLLTMVIFVAVFGRIGKLPSNGIPYPLLTFSGLMAWQLFANAFNESSSSVVGSATMLSKVYFPRLVIPLSAVISSLIDFLITSVILMAMLLYYGVAVKATVLLLPLFVLLVITFSLGAGIWFAALFVRFRDIRHVIPFVLQMGIYVSPVGFTSSLVPEKWRVLYALNPMVAAIDGFRWAIFGAPSLRPGELVVASLIAIGSLVGGVAYFRQTERTFADII